MHRPNAKPMSSDLEAHTDEEIQLVAAGLVRLAGSDAAAAQLERLYGPERAARALEALAGRIDRLRQRQAVREHAIQQDRRRRRRAAVRVAIADDGVPTPEVIDLGAADVQVGTSGRIVKDDLPRQGRHHDRRI